MATKKPGDPIAKHVLSYWKGGEPLWAAFWIYGMFVGVLFDTLLTPSLRAQLAMHDGTFLSCWGIMAMFAMGLIYAVWNFVSVWRCAKNASKPWGTVARVFYVLLLVAGAWFWLAGSGRDVMEGHHRSYFGMMGTDATDFFPHRRVVE
jgi:hypothetical protein